MRFWNRAAQIRLDRATLVTREWTEERGLIENEERFASLGELLDACLGRREAVPERITLSGTDRDGRERTVSFSFAAARSVI